MNFVREAVSETGVADNEVIPVTHTTPEMRCACAEERVERMLALGLTPREIRDYIVHSDLESDDTDEPC